MIIGTVTLISILLGGGGTFNIFVFDKIDKNIKKVVVDKKRKDLLLTELKLGKKEIKAYYKDRKNDIKSLKSLNLDRTASKEMFEKLNSTFIRKRSEIDQKVIISRVELVQNITDEEWQEIMDLAAVEQENQKNKDAEKEAKGKLKDDTDKLGKTIQDTIEDEEKREAVLSSFETFRNAFNEMEKDAITRYPSDNEILTNKNSEVDDLSKTLGSVTELRSRTYNAFVDFHFAIIEQTTEKEWQKIMKQVNKIYN